jgi:hypothetical protein
LARRGDEAVGCPSRPQPIAKTDPARLPLRPNHGHRAKGRAMHHRTPTSTDSPHVATTRPRRRLLRALAALVVAGAFGATLAHDAGATTPPRYPEPIDPPPVVPPPFNTPSNGFTWRVDGRFGDKIADPDDAQVPPLVNFHYCAPERPRVNCGGDVNTNKYKYLDSYVRPTQLRSVLDGCPTIDERDAEGDTQYAYTWRVTDASGTSTFGPFRTCAFQHDFPITQNTGKGDPTTSVQLTITNPGSSTAVLGSPFVQPVVVRDLLIVSIGDSYGSGEGNPDVPQKFATGPFDIPLPIVAREAKWEDKRCHRSATAGAAQAAMRLEMTDPHTSVTFLSFACSGANVERNALDNVNPLDPYNTAHTDNKGGGILTRYTGTVLPVAGNYADKLDDQITQVEHAVQHRTVDAMVMSGGGNDMGFVPVATVCTLVPDCATAEVTGPDGTSKVSLDSRLHSDLSDLHGFYGDLANRLDTDHAAGNLDVSRFYVTEYPDSTHGDDKNFCSAILDDVLPMSTVIGAMVIAPILSIAFPPLAFFDPAALLAMVATHAMPPYGMRGDEVSWAGNAVLPPGGASADHGLDHELGQAVSDHADAAVPWSLIGGITADFQGTGALSRNAGHGYCATNSWIRNAADATVLQGFYVPVLGTAFNGANTGMLHPNAAGHADYAAHIFDTLKPLIGITGAGPQQPTFANADTNSTGNTASNLQGTTTVDSVKGDNDWLKGCTPNGGLCPGHAVAQIVAAVNSSTTLKGASLSINGQPVDCDADTGLPAGVGCDVQLFAGDQLMKWSLQFANDGIYALSATVTGQDGSVGTTSHDVKVDLHDPALPDGDLSDGAPWDGWHKAPLTVTFDVTGTNGLQGVGVRGVNYWLDGQGPTLVKAASQVPAGTSPTQAQVQISAEGAHTLAFQTVDIGGRTSQTVTKQFRIDATAPTITVTRPTSTSYLLHDNVVASYGCTDGGSGVASCSGPVASGQAVDTSTNGTKTFTVQSADAVGNASSASVSYKVGYAVCALYDQTKAHKAGSVVPVKLQLCDAAGANQSSASIAVNAVGLTKVDNSASSDVDSASASSADTNFRWDASLGGYIYNLKTTGLTTGTWALSFTTAGDGLTHSVRFDIR